MNRNFFFSFILFLAAMTGFTACSETNSDVEEYPDWQNTNAIYFNNIFGWAIADISQNGDKSEWDTIRCWSLNDTVAKLNPTDYIVIHREETGTCKYVTDSEHEPHNHLTCQPADPNEAADRPLYTDSVMVYNFGKLLPSTTYSNGNVIEKSWDGIGGLKVSDDAATNFEADFLKFDKNTAVAKKWAVSGLIDGYTTALMRMHIGDRWRIYVPWTQGYGTATYNSIPGYSVLVWDVQLLGYYRAGETLPSSAAKNHNKGIWVTE